VWTTFEGRLGAVDERLIADGRMRRLERPEDVAPAKRDGDDPAGAAGGERVRRDPDVLAGLMLAPVGGLPDAAGASISHAT
jgi:hypothetical protein